MLAVIKVLSYIILFVPSFFREDAVKTVFRPVKKWKLFESQGCL